MTALIVDDHPTTRDGLRQMVADVLPSADLLEAEEVEQAWALASEHRAEFITMDIRLRDRESLELISRLRRELPKAKILVVSMCDELAYAPRVIKAGANGFVGKDASREETIAAIRRVADGRMHLSPDIVEKMILPGAISRTNNSLDLESLTDRELEVFRLIGQGLPPRRVATKLAIAARTVEAHKDNIKRKLGLANAAELARRAVLWFEGGGR